MPSGKKFKHRRENNYSMLISVGGIVTSQVPIRHKRTGTITDRVVDMTQTSLREQSQVCRSPYGLRSSYHEHEQDMRRLTKTTTDCVANMRQVLATSIEQYHSGYIQEKTKPAA
jgi:hypothetical protein